MQKKNSQKIVLAILIPLFALFITACSKKDDPTPPLASKEYSLVYNSASVGKVKISEKADGNASLFITLDASAVIAGASPTAAIVAVVSGTEAGLYSSLTTFTAGGTTSTTATVLDATPPNAPIPYATLVAKTGYKVKVTQNASIQYIATL